MIKAKGNDFDIYRRSWQIAMFYHENRLSGCGKGLLKNHLSNKKNSRQQQKMQTKWEEW
ncbi:MAG: hypothetical protein WCF03_06715 [Nitrososphaeraceae archaeon]